MVCPNFRNFLAGALLASAAALSAPPALAAGKIFCCDVNGKRMCGDNLPPQCYQSAHQEISAGGSMKQFGPPPTPEQKAQMAAEEKKRKEEEAKVAEQKRRDAALVASYGSERDIDAKRDRAIAEAQKNQKEVEDRYAAALAAQQRLANETEFYKNKAVPAQLASRVKENQTEVAAQQAALAARKQEIEDIRARFEQEKQRYLQLTGTAPTADGRPR